MRSASWRAVLAGGVMALVAASAWGQNLLVNPGAETGDLSGWTILANGGDGWAIWGVDTNSYEPPHSGSHCFMTSYNECRRSQEIDLVAAGFDPGYLDTAAPRIHVEEWFAQGNPFNVSRYQLRVELRDANHQPLVVWDTGWKSLPSSNTWVLESHDFVQYPPGVRYVYWEDAGVDSNNWAGWYGAEMDDAVVEVLEPTRFNHAVPALGGPGLAALALLLLGAGVLLVRRMAA